MVTVAMTMRILGSHVTERARLLCLSGQHDDAISYLRDTLEDDLPTNVISNILTGKARLHGVNDFTLVAEDDPQGLAEIGANAMFGAGYKQALQELTQDVTEIKVAARRKWIRVVEDIRYHPLHPDRAEKNLRASGTSPDFTHVNTAPEYDDGTWGTIEHVWLLNADHVIYRGFACEIVDPLPWYLKPEPFSAIARRLALTPSDQDDSPLARSQRCWLAATTSREAPPAFSPLKKDAPPEPKYPAPAATSPDDYSKWDSCWVSPSGTLYGCTYEEHDYLEASFRQNGTESCLPFQGLETQGWLKVSHGLVKDGGWGNKRSAPPTQSQMNTLYSLFMAWTATGNMPEIFLKSLKASLEVLESEMEGVN